MFAYVESLRPLEVHIQIAEPSVAGLEKHIEYVSQRMRTRSLLPHEQRMTYVIQQNGGNYRQANAQERKVLADWMARDFELMQKTSLGLSFVIDSTIIRGALTAVFWLTRTPMPYRVHGSVDEAVAMAVREITAAGIPVPPALADRGAEAVKTEIGKTMGTRAFAR